MPNAQTQYQLEVADIALVLAIARAGTLPATASRLGVDTSTVFRSLARIEKSLGQRLFERTRSGYCATDLALGLMQRAERIEIELEAARAASNARRDTIDGTVRITSTDTLLYGLLMPTLGALVDAHPLLQLELSATNELANLTKRDADIALRATKRPPITWSAGISGRFARRCLVRARAAAPSGARSICRPPLGSRRTMRFPTIRRCCGAAAISPKRRSGSRSTASWPRWRVSHRGSVSASSRCS